MLSSSDVSAVWRSRVTGHTRFSGWCRPFLCPAVELHPPVEGLFLKISLETGTFSFSQLMFAPFFFSLSNDLCFHGDRSGFGTETMTFISLEWLLDTCAYSHRTCHTYLVQSVALPRRIFRHPQSADPEEMQTVFRTGQVWLQNRQPQLNCRCSMGYFYITLTLPNWI